MGTWFAWLASARLARATNVSTVSRFRIFGPIRLTIISAVLLSVAVAIGAGLFLTKLRNNILSENQRQLSNTAFMVARQIEHIFTTIDVVQRVIFEKNIAPEISGGGGGERELSSHKVHQQLRDKAAGMPYVGALTIVNAQGRLINFSRQWPILLKKSAACHRNATIESERTIF